MFQEYLYSNNYRSHTSCMACLKSLLNHTLLLTSAILLKRYHSNSITIWRSLKESCHAVVNATQRHVPLHLSVSSFITRFYFFVFGHWHPADSVLCSRSALSFFILRTHEQVCVHMRKERRGVLHAANHAGFINVTECAQKTVQLSRLLIQQPGKRQHFCHAAFG